MVRSDDDDDDGQTVFCFGNDDEADPRRLIERMQKACGSAGAGRTEARASMPAWANLAAPNPNQGVLAVHQSRVAQPRWTAIYHVTCGSKC